MAYELPATQFFSLHRLLPVLQDVDRLRDLNDQVLLASAQNDRSGASGRQLQTYRGELQRRINRVLYQEGRAQGSTTMIMGRDGKEHRVYRKRLAPGQLTPREFLDKVNPHADRLTFGGGGARKTDSA